MESQNQSILAAYINPQPTAYELPCNRWLRERKNLSNIHNLLEDGMKSGMLTPGMVISTSRLATALGDTANQWFNRSYSRCDNHGVTRSLGDLLGGHGLQLRKVRPGEYVIPTVLPEVKNDRLYTEAIY